MTEYILSVSLPVNVPMETTLVAHVCSRALDALGILTCHLWCLSKVCGFIRQITPNPPNQTIHLSPLNLSCSLSLGQSQHVRRDFLSFIDSILYRLQVRCDSRDVRGGNHTDRSGSSLLHCCLSLSITHTHILPRTNTTGLSAGACVH